jgi:hypothetical protein
MKLRHADRAGHEVQRELLAEMAFDEPDGFGSHAHDDISMTYQPTRHLTVLAVSFDAGGLTPAAAKNRRQRF